MSHHDQNDAADGAADSTVRANEPKHCAHCGVGIDVEEWHPLLTRTGDDGSFSVYAFCNERCRDDWTGD